MSSGAGLMGVFGYTAYGASKLAMRGLAEALRGALRLEKIYLIVIPRFFCKRSFGLGRICRQLLLGARIVVSRAL